MGMFSTKKKTVVNADLIPLIDPKDRDTFAQRGLYRYIFDRERSMRLHERIIEEYQSSLPVRFEKAYRYASRPSYSIGLPKSNIGGIEVDKVKVVKEYLKRVYGYAVDDIQLDYVITSEPHLQHYAWVKLQELYGYNLNTNELEFLSTEKGFPVYLDTFQVYVGTITQSEVENPEYLDQHGLSAEWGATDTRTADTTRPHVLFQSSTVDPLDFTEVSYSWTEISYVTEIQQETQIITVVDPDTGEETQQEVLVDVEVQVEVRTPMTGELVLTYEDVIPPPAEEDMPVILETNEIQIMFTHLGVRYTHEYALYSNEDLVLEKEIIGELVASDYYPGVYARINLENLFERDKTDPVYKDLKGLCKRLQMDWVDWGTNLVAQMEKPHEIRDALITTVVPLGSDEPVGAKYGYKFIEDLIALADNLGEYTHKNGGLVGGSNTPVTMVGKPILYAGTDFTVADGVFSYAFKCKHFMVVQHSGVKCPVGTYTGALDPMVDVSTWFDLGRYSAYFYQDTESTFIEYRVYGAVTTYTINSRQATEKVLPLRRSLVQQYFNNRDKERLFQLSAYIYIGTSVVVKTKWYARGAFKAVMFIAAVVVSIFTAGAGLAAFAAWQTAITAVAVATVQTIAVSLVITMLSRVLVSLGLDSSVMQIVAVVLIVAAAFVGAGGSIGELTASQLMAYSNEALRISTEMNNIQLAQLQEKLIDISNEFKNKMEEIANLQDTVGLLSPEMLLEISSVFYESRLGESVEQFHTRTTGLQIHEITESQISEFVDIMTALPDFQTTMNMLRKTV